jgi:hypothetical protein
MFLNNSREKTTNFRFLYFSASNQKHMKILRLAFILLLGFFSHTITAQAPYWQWAKGDGNTGNNLANQICTDFHRNSYTVGAFSAASVTFSNTTLTNPYPGTSQILIVKYDSTGNIQWAKTAPSSGASYAATVASDANGNVYVCGSYGGTMIIAGDTLTNDSIFSNNFFIIKYDVSGNMMWAKQNKSYPNPGHGNSTKPTNMICDINGNVIIAGRYIWSDSVVFDGHVLSGSSGLFFFNFLVKYDASGNVIWAESGQRDDVSTSNGISTDAVGNIYVSGANSGTWGSATYGGFPDQLSYYLCQFGPSGSLIWANTLYGGWNCVGTNLSICTDANGNSFIGGVIPYGVAGLANELVLGTDTLNNINGGVFIAKYDSSGNLAWAKTDGGAVNLYTNINVSNITSDSNGGIYLDGTFVDTITFNGSNLISAGQQNIFIAKYDTSGNSKWAISAGGSGTESVFISADTKGNIYAGGTSTSPTLDLGGIMLNNQSTGDIFVGKLTYYPSGISPVTNTADKITVYPNPSTGSFYFSGVTEGSTIEVYDMMGQNILMPGLSPLEKGGTAAVDLSGRAAGVYFYRVSDQGATVQQGKLVVE